MFLAAIIPPNNAYTTFIEFKRGIFRDTSALSSWALQPMIPFLFTEREPDVLKRNALPKIPEQGISLNEVTVSNGQCIVSSDSCRNFCDSLNPLFDAFSPSSGLCGLHLFDTADCSVKSADIEAAVLKLDPGVSNWHNCSIAVFRSGNYLFNDTKPAGKDGWPCRIELETLYEIRFQRTEKS